MLKQQWVFINKRYKFYNSIWKLQSQLYYLPIWPKLLMWHQRTQSRWWKIGRPITVLLAVGNALRHKERCVMIKITLVWLKLQDPVILGMDSVASLGLPENIVMMMESMFAAKQWQQAILRRHINQYWPVLRTTKCLRFAQRLLPKCVVSVQQLPKMILHR